MPPTPPFTAADARSLAEFNRIAISEDGKHCAEHLTPVERLCRLAKQNALMGLTEFTFSWEMLLGPDRTSAELMGVACKMIDLGYQVDQKSRHVSTVSWK